MRPSSAGTARHAAEGGSPSNKRDGNRSPANARGTLPPARGPPAVRRRTAPVIASPHALCSARQLTLGERERFEPLLGYDLGHVRIFGGPPAEAAAAQEHAHAFTYGSNIVLGRAVQDAPAGVRLAVIAHELVHVCQQAGGTANDNRIGYQARAPPDHEICISAAPLGVMSLDEDDDSIIPAWASEAAGEVAEFAADTAGAVVDRLAPGLLEFLRGGALGKLTDFFCSGINTLIGTLFSSLGEIDFMSEIESAFNGIAEGVRGVQAAIGSAASAAVGTVLGPLVEALQTWGGPLVEVIQSAATSVNELFSGVWEELAVPALDILESIGGAVWQGFNDLVTWVWDLIEPIRTGAETAWNWLLETFDLAWNSTSGIRDWLSEKASDAWSAFLETIEPIREPLEAVAGVALLLSPLGPIIVLTQVVPPLWEKITWLWNNWNTEDILVTARDTLQNDILPAIIGTVSGVASAIGEAASWLAGLVAEFGSTMSGVLGAFGASSCLTVVTTYLNSVAGQFERLSAWADSGFDGLSEVLQAVFDALVAIFQPVLNFLVRLAIVALNPPMLPIAIVGAIWLLCPDDLKPAVINFVLDLLIAFVDGSTVLLIGLGPMALVLKSGVLGFLRELRGGAEFGDNERIAASNKIANLAAGGGPAFVAGFSLGFLHGVVDGVIDPFRLIFLIGQALVAGAQVVGRVFAPFVLSHVPGAAGAVAGVREAFAVPPSTGPPAAESAPREEPALEGPAPSSANALEPAAETTAANAAGVEASAGELPPLAPAPGELSDTEIIEVLGPGAAADISAEAAGPPINEAAQAGEMRGEMEMEGASIGGLARLLGEAWDWLMQGSENLGCSAANAFMEFILLPDFQLGRKLGFVTGYVALQALVIYLTAGGYAAVAPTAPFWRQALSLFLRFLDLGGEILGVIGKVLRPLKGPLNAGLGAARGFLSKFKFARGLIERIEGLAAKLFRFGDEAAAATGSRGAREAAEEGAERTVREGAEETGERVARESAEEGTERTGRREATEEAGDRASREAAERTSATTYAAAIVRTNDRVDTPIPLLLAQLNGLRTRFTWIRRFEARPLVPPARYSIHMIASDVEIGDYTLDTFEHLSDEELERLIRENPKGTTDAPTLGDRLRFERYRRGGGEIADFDDWLTRSRGGRSGGPAHQAKQADLLAEGGTGARTEYPIGDRFADVYWPRGPDGRPVVHQIGGVNPVRGDPIMREREAIEEIRRALGDDVDIWFHNKNNPLAPPIRNPDRLPNWHSTE
jgi:hypothetical protein